MWLRGCPLRGKGIGTTQKLPRFWKGVEGFGRTDNEGAVPAAFSAKERESTNGDRGWLPGINRSWLWWWLGEREGVA